MNFRIASDYSIWLVVLCLLLGIIYSLILYFRENQLVDISLWLKRTLAIIRALSIALISFLLLNPLLKSISRQVEKPIIIIGQDNSESLIFSIDSSYYKSQYLIDFRKFKERLANKYEVREYAFGDHLIDVFDNKFNAKETNISGFIDEINTRYSNRNIGAIVICSDGLYNKGQNPVYSPNQLKAPIYTIALGDTAIKNDLILSKVNYNKIAYLGNKFPLEIIIDAKKLNGKKSKLSIIKDKEIILSQEFNIYSDNFNLTIPAYIEVNNAGMQRYQISLSEVKGETTTINNRQDIYVDVLDTRQKILILADAPHPDVNALKQVIESNENYEVSVLLASDFTKSLKEFNLVILHQLPSLRNPIQKILIDIETYNISKLFIIGNQTSINLFNNTKTGLTITGFNNRYNESQAFANQNFSLFNLSDKNKKIIKNYPPLSVPFGIYKIENSVYPLLKQKIGIVETSDPLLIFNNQDEEKTGIILGEGIWRWRLFDYAENKSHDNFNELFGKTIQFLSLKVDKSFFRISGKNNFLENDQIEFDAEVYNNSYELINTPEVTITIINESDKKYPFSFTKTTNAYRLNIGVLPVGKYKYEAKVQVGDKQFTEKGEFTVSALQLEAINIVADHNLLFQLAEKNGGMMYAKNEFEQLAKALEDREDIKPISYSQTKLNELINFKAIFFLILGFLSFEWFIRKRSGAY